MLLSIYYRTDVRIEEENCFYAKILLIKWACSLSLDVFSISASNWEFFFNTDNNTSFVKTNIEQYEVAFTEAVLGTSSNKATLF